MLEGAAMSRAMLVRAVAVASATLVGVVGLGVRTADAKTTFPTACMLFNVEAARQYLGNGVVLGQSPVDITGRTSSCVFGIPTGSSAFGALSPMLTVTAERGTKKSFADRLGPRAPDSNSTRTRIRLPDTDGGSQTAWYTTTPSGSDNVLVMYRKGQLWSVRVRGTSDELATAQAVMQALVRSLPLVVTGD